MYPNTYNTYNTYVTYHTNNDLIKAYTSGPVCIFPSSINTYDIIDNSPYTAGDPQSKGNGCYHDV